MMADRLSFPQTPSQPASLTNDLIRSSQRSRAFAAGASKMAAQDHTVTGQFLLNGPGEAEFPVIFPVTFTDMPFFLSGVSLPATEKVLVGSLPVVTSFMFNWTIEERPAMGLRLYKGCSMGVVADGPPGMKAIVHWSLSGTCLTNPYQ